MCEKRKFFWRGIAIAVMIGAVVFSVQLPGKVSYGDRIFQSLGLPAWSQGMDGWHYSVLAGIGIAFGAMVLYAMTTKDRLKTFRRFMEGTLFLLLLLWLLDWFRMVAAV